MKPESQIAILKTIVKWQADEIEALQERLQAATELTNIREEQLRDELAEVAQLQGQLKALEQGTLTGSIQGDTETLTVTVPPKWEDGAGNEAV